MIDKETLYNLYWEQGLSVRQIGKILGKSERTIRNWMEKYGIPRRSYKEAWQVRKTQQNIDFQEPTDQISTQILDNIIESLADKVPEVKYDYQERENINISLPLKALEKISSNERPSLTVTIVISDLHLGHESHLPETYWSCIYNLERVLKFLSKIFDIKRARVVLNGDIVSGRNIYRKQELENLIQRGHWQVFLAERVIKRTLEQIEQIVPVHKVYLIKGHHEDTESNYMLYLKKSLGDKATYCSRYVILDIGEPIGHYNVLFTHGYGRSQYYPVSPSFIRDILKTLSDFKSRGIVVERIVTAHSHWLNPEIIFESTRISVTGGFQKWQYSIQQRPSGILLLIYSEDECSVVPIQPLEQIETFERTEPNLEYKNMAYYAQILREHYKYYEKEYDSDERVMTLYGDMFEQG